MSSLPVRVEAEALAVPAQAQAGMRPQKKGVGAMSCAICAPVT